MRLKLATAKAITPQAGFTICVVLSWFLVLNILKRLIASWKGCVGLKIFSVGMP